MKLFVLFSVLCSVALAASTTGTSNVTTVSKETPNPIQKDDKRITLPDGTKVHVKAEYGPHHFDSDRRSDFESERGAVKRKEWSEEHVRVCTSKDGTDEHKRLYEEALRE